jgi:signal transduction histidine kinase
LSHARSFARYHKAEPHLRPEQPRVRDAVPLLVSDTRATAMQRGVALGIMIFLAAAFAMAAPFYSVSLPVVPAFVPVVHAIVCVTSLIAAAFLFSQYAVQRQPAFLALAAGYLLAGLFAFFQSLAFPNAYSATGLIGATPSAAAWLFVAWRTSFPLGVVAYALIRLFRPSSEVSRSVGVAIAAVTCGTVVTACALTWTITVADAYLPMLFTDAHHESWIGPYTTIPAIALSLTAILLLSRRRHTTLDLWLAVTLIVALPDIVVPVSRYALGFYLARSYELISSSAVLIALLTESSILYARLASARTLQVHGEAERLSTLETATAAIAHELRQPLSAIRIHSEVGVTLLDRPVPPLGEISAILRDIGKDAHRAGDVIERIREGLRQQELWMEALDINALVSDAVKLLSENATSRHVTVGTTLSSAHPYVAGDRTQLTQLLLNLMTNGMDAMETVPDAERRLAVLVAKRGEMVEISVEDRGCGINPESMPRIFEPFFTTRREGMGLGLSISRSIVVAHQGRLWAESDGNRGAVFHVSMRVWDGGGVTPA